jgi:hypothetical protein
LLADFVWFFALYNTLYHFVPRCITLYYVVSLSSTLYHFVPRCITLKKKKKRVIIIFNKKFLTLLMLFFYVFSFIVDSISFLPSLVTFSITFVLKFVQFFLLQVHIRHVLITQYKIFLWLSSLNFWCDSFHFILWTTLFTFLPICITLFNFEKKKSKVCVSIILFYKKISYLLMLFVSVFFHSLLISFSRHSVLCFIVCHFDY